MPEAKKISELPVLSSVQPNDILPIVDSLLTQTSKCTASQIAGLGGGPPGNNTVETSHLKDAIVTAQKTYFSGPDKLFSRIAAGAGAGTEITCTTYARGLLAAADGPSARSYLNSLQSTEDPTFTGQVKLANGTALAPSLTNIDNLDTGLFFPENAVVSLTTDGYESFRVGSDGAQFSNIIDVDFETSPGAALRPLYPQYVARAWLHMNAVVGGDQAYTITNQHIIARRYRGVWGSLADLPVTRQKIIDLEAATTGWTVTFPANYQVGTEGRTNYTTPGDNFHYYWDSATSTWKTMAAAGQAWIGRIRLNPPADGRQIIGSGNIAAVTYGSSTGVFDIAFQAPMPDATYAVVASCSSDSAGGSTGVVRTVSPTTAGFRITTANVNGTAITPGWISVVVFR